jgi:3-dehydroquinate dehydratase/shikimate dehydrogenase
MKTNAVKICVPISVSRANEIIPAMNRAAEAGDLIELRLDYLEQQERHAALLTLLNYLKTSDKSLIVTLRSQAQGGQAVLDDETRQRFWLSLNDLPGNSFADLELDLVNEFSQNHVNEKLAFEWDQVICSHHDFKCVPADLTEIYQRLAATPARVVKIAVQASDSTDCLAIFRLLERAYRDGREIIAIAMGAAGVMTRVLGPSRGSFLTYGSLADQSATAPGQLTARELRDVYRIDRLDRSTAVLGIIGNPVGHSLSPYIHNAAFAANSINAVYLPLEVRDAGQFIRRMVRPDSREIDWHMRGLSVTAPHKSAVMEHLDWIDPGAKEIGAVNTIVIREGQLHGFNTDAAGFISPLQDKFESLRNVRCAIIGAGGGARAALWALGRQNADSVLFARDLQKGKSLAQSFDIGCRPLADACFEGFDLVVNTTPLGTQGSRENETPVSGEKLRGVRLAYDLVYNPSETRFLREARLAGCETLSGFEMLIAQAIEQFKLWIGGEPDAQVMRAAALRKLAGR